MGTKQKDEGKGGREKGAPPPRRSMKPSRTATNKAREAKRRQALAIKAVARRVTKANREMDRLQVKGQDRIETAAMFSNRPTNKLRRSIHRYIKARRLLAALVPLPPEVPNA